MSSTHSRRTIETPLHYITDGQPDSAGLYDYIQEFAEKQKKTQTLKALPYGREMHSGQYRLGGDHLDYTYIPCLPVRRPFPWGSRATIFLRLRFCTMSVKTAG